MPGPVTVQPLSFEPLKTLPGFFMYVAWFVSP